MLWWALKSETSSALHPDVRRSVYGISNEQYARAQYLLRATKVAVPRDTLGPTGAAKGHVKHFRLSSQPMDNASIPELTTTMQDMVAKAAKQLARTDKAIEIVREELDGFDFFDEEGNLIRAGSAT